MRLGAYTKRAVFARPARTILTIFSIVTGVAAVVAVTVVTASTRQSYKQLFSTLNGNAAFEIVSPTSASIPQNLTELAADTPGVAAAVPLVRQWTAMRVDDQRVRLQCLGIDPELDHYVRGMQVESGRALRPDDGDKILLESDFAAQLDIEVGDEVRLLVPRRFSGERIGPVPMEVIGLVKLSGGTALTQSGVTFMSLAQAQARFVGPGMIDAVQIVPTEDADQAALKAAIQAKLPTGIEIRPPQGSSTVLEGTLSSTEQGLQLATVFSLVMAGFIILNTFMMNVSERRRHLAIMRVVGATRRQLLVALLGESLLLGVLGTVLGIGAGLLAAWGLTNSLANVLDIPLPAVSEFITSPLPYVLGGAFGMLISLFGALAPAIRAQKISPLEGLSWVAASDLAGPQRKKLIAGVVLFVVGGAVVLAGILGYIPIDAPIYGAAALLISIVLLLPAAVGPLSWLAAWPVRLLCPVETDLAVRQVLRHRGRSALTAGVLFIAGSTGVGMAHSILDNVADVKGWSRRALVGDFYLRALMPDFGSGTAADLPEGVDSDLRQMEGIDHLDRIKLIEGEVARTTPRAGGEAAENGEPETADVVFVIRDFSSPGELPLELIAGDKAHLREKMAQGEVVIGSVLANRMGWHVGDKLEMSTIDGRQQVQIAGIMNEYLVGGQGVYAEWTAAEKLFGIHGADGYIIDANDAALDALKPKLAALAKEYGILLHSTAEITRQVDRIIIGIDAGLWGLVILGFVVASFGVVNTLSMSVMEQTRELGMLRIIAMTRRQVRRTILAQATVIGGVGLVPGVAAGVAVAYVMNLAMEPSFGRKIEFGFHPWLLVSTLVGALVIILIASFVPAERAARINVSEALHYE